MAFELGVAAATFPLVALGELPDKTMFASLVLASRGRPLPVWVGASVAFCVHVAIAVSIGEAVFALLPHRAVDLAVAAIFVGGAVWSWRSRNESEEGPVAETTRSGLGVALTACGVIFLAEWGDLTQVITVNLAARFHSWLSVGVGALAALLLVAAVAVVGGAGLVRILSVRVLRSATAVVLLGLGCYELVSALTG